MVAERYLSRDDGDCDGTTIYDLAVYEEGQRPELYTWVRDGGSEGITYPAPNDIWEFEYCLNDGHWSEPYSEEEYDEDEWLSYLDDELSDEDDELSSEGSKDG
ncbi:MAG TPA: hypothetical protein VG992_03745 [Candidatus Saccharimonadales bacterium]|nr:hypothetical protein [Candidatus Saccharimonadales bacterium]